MFSGSAGGAPNFTKKGDLKDVSDKKIGSIKQQTDVSTPVSSGGEHSKNLTTTLKRQGDLSFFFCSYFSSH